MTLTEQRIIGEIAVLPHQNAIHVKWLDQILRDGEVISSIPHRKSYGAGQQAEFEAEVDGADAYVGLIDWTVVEDEPHAP